MTTATDMTTPGSPVGDDAGSQSEQSPAGVEGRTRMVHPSDMIYVKVGVVLAVLTAIEIALPEMLDDGRIYGPALIILMVIKFLLVAMIFMHLRYESRLLSTVFYGGAVLAIVVYVATLSVFVFWKDSGIGHVDDPPPPQVTFAPEVLNPEGG